MKNIIYRIEFELIELMESRNRKRRPYTGDRKWKTGARGGGRIPETGDRKWKIEARSGVQGSLESLCPR